MAKRKDEEKKILLNFLPAVYRRHAAIEPFNLAYKWPQVGVEAFWALGTKSTAYVEDIV